MELMQMKMTMTMTMTMKKILPLVLLPLAPLHLRDPDYRSRYCCDDACSTCASANSEALTVGDRP
jgi:hypothetical protein